MTDDDKEQAKAGIRYFVRSGYYGTDKIAEIICEERFDPETMDRTWVVDQIAEELASHRQNAEAWSHPTDCERLEKAFAELRGKRIIVAENAGYTPSEGIETITEIWQEAGEENSNIIGYCFFHGQDLEDAVADKGLMFSFGDILGADEKGLQVGRVVVEVLRKHGFEVEWNGTIEERINIPNIAWRKSFNG